MAQLGSARRSGRRGRRFKSCHPDQSKAPLTVVSERGFFMPSVSPTSGDFVHLFLREYTDYRCKQGETVYKGVQDAARLLRQLGRPPDLLPRVLNQRGNQKRAHDGRIQQNTERHNKRQLNHKDQRNDSQCRKGCRQHDAC